MILGALSVTGCGGNAESIINNAIATLQAQPGQWQQVLSSTLAQLKSVSGEVFNDVDSLYNNVAGQTQSFVFCATDFFGERAREGLEAIRHNIDPKQPAPRLVPVVCDTNPSTSILAGTTALVTYYGYNFNVYGVQSPFRTALEYSDGQVITPSFGHINTVSPYEVEVEFQGASFSGVDRNRGPKVVLSWGSGPVGSFGKGTSSLPVLIPNPPQPVTGHEDFSVNVHANSGLFSGDCATIDQTYTIASGPTGTAMIDRSKGNPGHPGLSEIANNDNSQSRNSLRGYTYLPTSNTAVHIGGTICGASAEGPGAIFDRTYRVYTIDYGSKAPRLKAAGRPH